MLKGREIHGLTVYAGRAQEEIGRAVDVVVDEITGALCGLIIASNGLWQKNLYVDIPHVRVLGRQGIIVPNKSHIKKMPKNLNGIKNLGWVGSQLVSREGHDLGTVADFLIKDGRISGLEISGGIINDLTNRREFMPWENVAYDQGFFIGEDIQDGGFLI
jgi:uncharacterized protein YrrD